MISSKNTPLLWRIFALLVIFIIVSGTIGPRIIGKGLVGEYGFEIYGGSGKALIFAVITFGLLTYRKSLAFSLSQWKLKNAFWLVVSAASLVMLWIVVTKLQEKTGRLIWPILTHILILTTLLCATIGIFGVGNLRKLSRQYKNELLMALAVGVGFYVFLELVYGTWRELAQIVMYSVRWLLEQSGLFAITIPPDIISLDKFAIRISQFCSGIESIALFTGLYALVGLVDRDRLNFKKYAAVFIPGLLAIFGCNVLRVYGLIMAGYYINPRIAFSLFHTYAGMIFFIIYSAIFWRLTYKWMLKGNKPNLKFNTE